MSGPGGQVTKRDQRREARRSQYQQRQGERQRERRRGIRNRRLQRAALIGVAVLLFLGLMFLLVQTVGGGHLPFGLAVPVGGIAQAAALCYVPPRSAAWRGSLGYSTCGPCRERLSHNARSRWAGVQRQFCAQPGYRSLHRTP